MTLQSIDENSDHYAISAAGFKLSQSTTEESDDFSTGITIRFPPFIKAGLFGDVTAAFQEAKTREDPSRTVALLAVAILVTISHHKFVLWDTATLEGGQSLELKHLAHTREPHATNNIEQLAVWIPEDELIARRDVGFKLKISRPDEFLERILVVPPEHLQAVLCLRYPEKCQVEEEDIKQEVVSGEQKIVAEYKQALMAIKFIFPLLFLFLLFKTDWIFATFLAAAMYFVTKFAIEVRHKKRLKERAANAE